MDRADGGATIGQLTEEELLRRILPQMGWAPGSSPGPAAATAPRSAAAAEEGGPGVLLGPGDDAALLAVSSGAVLVTTDTMVRTVDWRDDWSTAADVGHKVVAQNLADIAAMGGVCTGLVVALVADTATPVDWAVELSRGIGEAARAAGVAVVGGDLSSAPSGTVVVAVTALGDMGGLCPVRRSGARAGDVVAVAGTLGRSAAGLQLLLAGAPDRAPDLVADHRRPRPPYREGPVAARAGATAMIDVSDGLVRDAGRVASASGVRLAFNEAALAPDVAALSLLLGPDLARRCVLTGGEEHALVATFPAAGEVPAGWRTLGRVEGGSGVTVGGVTMHGGGWDHFAGARE